MSWATGLGTSSGLPEMMENAGRKLDEEVVKEGRGPCQGFVAEGGGFCYRDALLSGGSSLSSALPFWAPLGIDLGSGDQRNFVA